MENNKKKYWGKTITSFVFVLFTMPLGHAMMRIMEDTMSHSAVNTSAVIMGFVGLAMAVIGVFVKGDTKRSCADHNRIRERHRSEPSDANQWC